MIFGSCKMDLLAGHLHVSYVFWGSGAGNLHFPRFFEGPGGGRRERISPNDAGIAVWWPLGGDYGGDEGSQLRVP